MESDSSDESSDGWIEVESDGGHDLDISDSEDEREKAKTLSSEYTEGMEIDHDVPPRISSLAVSKVCCRTALFH